MYGRGALNVLEYQNTCSVPADSRGLGEGQKGFLLQLSPRRVQDSGTGEHFRSGTGEQLEPYARDQGHTVRRHATPLYS